jgi:hypothetical protein
MDFPWILGARTGVLADGEQERYQEPPFAVLDGLDKGVFCETQTG